MSTESNRGQSNRDQEPTPPVAQQRAELADTVDALHDRLDIPGRARAEASARKNQVKRQAGENKNLIAGVLGALGLAAVLAVVARRRRNNHRSN